MIRTFSILVISLLAFPMLAIGAEQAEVERVLGMAQAPEGVVFEVVTGDPAALARAIPRVTRHAERLRARFPGLAIAVVIHGREQFALMSKRQGQFGQLHRDVRRLTGGEDVQVHVCGTYAQRNGVAPEEFPDYVNVAPSGPAQLNDYIRLGYVPIRLKP